MRHLLISFALFFAGCGLAREGYLTKDYNVGDMRSATVGGVMLTWEQGTKNSVYNFVLSGTRRELVYNGISDSTIFVAYREYLIEQSGALSGAFVKPGFSNELKYSLRGNRLITYQDFVLEVIDATPQLIRFNIIKDFSTSQSKLENKNK